MEKFGAANSRLFASRTFQIICLGMPPSECSLVFAIFTTTAELAFWGGDPQCSLFSFSCCGTSSAARSWSNPAERAYVACFLVLSLFLAFPFRGKKTTSKLFVFFSMLSTSFKFCEMKIHCFWEREKQLSSWPWVLPGPGLAPTVRLSVDHRQSSLAELHQIRPVWLRWIEIKQYHLMIMTEYKQNIKTKTKNRHKMDQTPSNVKNGRSDCCFFANHSLVFISWSLVWSSCLLGVSIIKITDHRIILFSW